MTDPTTDPDTLHPICKKCGLGDIDRTDTKPREVVLVTDDGNFHSACHVLWRKQHRAKGEGR